MEFAQRVSTSPELGYKIVGFVDDDWDGIHSFDRDRKCLLLQFRWFSGFPSHTMLWMKPPSTCLFALTTSTPLSWLPWENTEPQFDLTRRFLILGRRTRRLIWTAIPNHGCWPKGQGWPACRETRI